MKILIVTGIYPPEIGGPAEYARNLKEVWVNRGDYVSLKVFSKFKNIPLGIRHIIFFFYIIPSVVTADYIFTLDAFSAGVVTVAAKLFNKKVIFRTGGDVLWELYVERTGDMEESKKQEAAYYSRGKASWKNGCRRIVRQDI